MPTDELLQRLTFLLSLTEEDRDLGELGHEVAAALVHLFQPDFVALVHWQPSGNGPTLLASSGDYQRWAAARDECIRVAAAMDKEIPFQELRGEPSLQVAFSAYLLSWIAKEPLVYQSRVAFSAVILYDRQDAVGAAAVAPLITKCFAALFSRSLAKSRRDRRIEFLRHLTEIPSRDIDRVFSTLLESFIQAVPSRFVSLWLYNDLDDTLVIRSFAPATIGGRQIRFSDLDVQVLRLGSSLTGQVIQSGKPTAFTEFGDRFQNPKFAKRQGLKWLLSLPLRDAEAGHSLGALNLWPEGSPEDFDPSTVELLSAYVSPVSAAVRLSYLLFQESLLSAYDDLFERMLAFSDREEWWNDLAQLVRNHMRCEGCSIFLRGKGDRLYLKGTTGLEGGKRASDTTFYEKNVGLTGTTFGSGRPQIYHIEFAAQFRDIHRSLYRETTRDKSRSIILVPIFGVTGLVEGVLRCNNKKEIPARQVGRFTHEDLAHLRQIAKLISNLHARTLWLRTREEERSRALTSLGHELKAPVATMLHHSEWLSRQQPEYLTKREIRARLRLKLDDVHRNSQLLNLLVANITETDDIVVVWERVRAKSFVNRCVSCVFDEARAAQIQFLTGELGVNYFICDSLQMMRVVFNLLRNAVKYHDRQEKSRYISVSAREEKGNWTIGVSDNGIGVPAGEETKIFGQFNRGSNAARVYPQGTGLGLYFCKRIADAHDGGVRLTSQGKPTQFEVFWPVRRRED